MINKKRYNQVAIRNALSNVWKCATNQPNTEALMHIPPDKNRDCDFILHSAVDELFELRAENKRLTDLIHEVRHELNRLALRLSPKGECLLDQKDAEIERLREFVQEIAAYCDNYHSDAYAFAQNAKELLEALQEKE